jgi:FKBP-type peptidyl-prolyl cis-trans isomerase FkpA
MKKYVFLLFVIPFFFSCKKDDCGATDPNIVASAEEIEEIELYLADHSITATQHSSGMFYVINEAGTGATPELCSIVTVRYMGKLANGDVFDGNATGIRFKLGNLIAGWKKGLPLIKAGGSITLYIPPSLGYGDQAVGIIPANSMLIFEIQLDAVE